MVVDPKELKKLIDDENDKTMQLIEKNLDDILNEQVRKDGVLDVTIVPGVQLARFYSNVTPAMENSILDKYRQLGWNAFYELAKDGKPYVWRFKYNSTDNIGDSYER